MLMKFLKFFLVFILCVPLLFINIRKDIDWGDDSALYLMQAKYITQGTPQENTQYIYNSDRYLMGPPAYPIGFPIMLSIVYYFYGLDFHAISIFITITLISLCLLILLYYF